jgi:hypothetical protein
VTEAEIMGRIIVDLVVSVTWLAMAAFVWHEQHIHSKIMRQQKREEEELRKQDGNDSPPEVGQ